MLKYAPHYGVVGGSAGAPPLVRIQPKQPTPPPQYHHRINQSVVNVTSTTHPMDAARCV